MSKLEQPQKPNPSLKEIIWGATKEVVDTGGYFAFNITYEAIQLIFPKLDEYISNNHRGI